MTPASAPAPAVAVAPACTADRRCEHVDAPALFRLAVRLEQDGELNAAGKVLTALRQDPDRSIRSEATFRLGGLLERKGDFAGAAALYRAILAEQPALGSVRLALARVLAQDGRGRMARGELRKALADGLPDKVARTVDRFATALRSTQRLGATLEAGLAPDSNISHATTRDTVAVGGLDFLLTPDARQRAGFGGYGVGQAYWRPEIARDVNLFTALSGSASLYGAARFDDVEGSINIGPELVRPAARVQLTALLGQHWFGGRRYSRSYGGSLSVIIAAGRRTRVEATAQTAQVRYPAIAAQTGLQAGGSVSLERQLTPRLTARITAQAEHDDAKSGAFTTWTYGGSVLISRALGRSLLFLTGSRYAIEGAGPFAFPPATRDDRLWQAQAGLQLAPVLHGGFKPVARIRYANNRSPVFFYQYHEVRGELGIAHDF